MMKKLNKKYLLVGISLLLCLTIGVTFALSRETSNTLLNKFLVGSLESEIIEEKPEVTDGKIDKNPKVVNTGSTNALLRVRITVSPEELWTPNGVNNILSLDINNDKWTYQDGYYYYQDILKPGESNSVDVFKEVTLNAQSGYESIKDLLEDKGKFNIAIYQETIATKATDGSGDEISAIVDGKFNSDKANQVWDIYEKLNK